mgnify:FL=1
MIEKKNNDKKNNDGMVEDVRYYGNIPNEILEEMTPEIIEQYYLWDEVAKKEVERYPWLILPLIREVFHKIYPPNVRIRLLATEYVVKRIHKGSGSTLNSIFADIAVQIGDGDIYHLECQMNKDHEMVLRMLEYDIHIGLVYGIGNYGKRTFPGMRHELVMPRSVILYLDHAKVIPAEEICLIRFADGTTHEYRVPVMGVQSYTTEMIEKKHLNILIPFLPIRFRRNLKGKKNGEMMSVLGMVRKDLTELVRECMMIIEREKRNGTLTEDAGKEIIELMDITCSHLLRNEPELKREVQGIMRPIVMTYTERFDEAVKRLITKEYVAGRSRKEVKTSIRDIFSLDEKEAEEKMEKYWQKADQ